MKKYLLAGLLAATLIAPAFAQSKLAAESPEQPVHRRTIAAAMISLVVLGLARQPLTRPSKTRHAQA